MITRFKMLTWSLLVVAATTAAAQTEDIRWKKSVSPDRSMSLHCPITWGAAHDGVTVTLSNDDAGEQILIIRLPRESGKAASAYADQIVDLFRKGGVDFRTSNPTTSDENFAFLIALNMKGRAYSGLGVIAMHPSTVFWASYASPDTGNIRRGAALLTAVADSIADNENSQPPARLSVSVAAAKTPQTPSAPASSPSAAPTTLVGDWSTTSYFGSLVDANTGAFAQHQYSGQWYTFRADGTYHYAIAGSGRIISGIAMSDGTYEVRGNRLLLHKKIASWYPFSQSAASRPRYKNKVEPDEMDYAIELRASGDLAIWPPSGGADFFHRAPSAK